MLLLLTITATVTVTITVTVTVTVYDCACDYFGNCEEELPKKPVGRLSVNCRPSDDRQVTDSLPTANQQVTVTVTDCDCNCDYYSNCD